MALLVIDVQKGLFERSTPIYKAELVLENINTLIKQARKADVPVVFIQHSNNKTLLKDTDAWKLHPEIKPQDGELSQSNVGVLVVTGLVTHGCVKATSLGAMDMGYKVTLASDGHSNFSEDAVQLINKWNQAISEKGAELTRTQDVYFVGS